MSVVVLWSLCATQSIAACARPYLKVRRREIEERLELHGRHSLDDEAIVQRLLPRGRALTTGGGPVMAARQRENELALAHAAHGSQSTAEREREMV